MSIITEGGHVDPSQSEASSSVTPEEIRTIRSKYQAVANTPDFYADLETNGSVPAGLIAIEPVLYEHLANGEVGKLIATGKTTFKQLLKAQKENPLSLQAMRTPNFVDALEKGLIAVDQVVALRTDQIKELCYNVHGAELAEKVLSYVGRCDDHKALLDQSQETRDTSLEHLKAQAKQGGLLPK